MSMNDGETILQEDMEAMELASRLMSEIIENIESFVLPANSKEDQERLMEILSKSMAEKYVDDVDKIRRGLPLLADSLSLIEHGGGPVCPSCSTAHTKALWGGGGRKSRGAGFMRMMQSIHESNPDLFANVLLALSMAGSSALMLTFIARRLRGAPPTVSGVTTASEDPTVTAASEDPTVTVASKDQQNWEKLVQGLYAIAYFLQTYPMRGANAIIKFTNDETSRVSKYVQWNS
eukprot:763100-Hanusia_phi.AAC.20